jgi:N-acetylmuramoyl-L-alanine amidase
MLRRTAILAIALAGVSMCAGADAAVARAHPHVSQFAMPLPADATARAAGGAFSTGTLRPRERFDLVGLRWSERGAGAGATVRVRHGRRWSPWVSLADADDHGPDHAGATRGTDPVWAGGADALQLRMKHRPRGLKVQLVRVTHRVHPRVRTLAHAASTVTGPPPMVMRAQWDPANQCPPRTEPSYGRVDMAFVHHTVSANEYAPGDTAAMVLAICRYHRNDNEWNDIGYNFLVDKYGQLFEGRAGGIDKPVVGAHAQGFNDVSTSVSNIGTFDNVPVTDAAMQAMANLLAWKLPYHGAPVSGTVPETSGGGSQNRYRHGEQVAFERISGHRDGGKTTCPGDALYAQLPQLRDMVAARAPAPGTLGGQPENGPATVTMTADRTRLVYPAKARLAGTATGGGRVFVQALTGSGFRTVARTTPNAAGSWAADYGSSQSRVVRAIAVGADGRPGATSKRVTLTVQPSLTARVTRRVRAGRATVVTGKVAPRKGTIHVSVAVQGTDRRMRTVARQTVKATAGAFRARVTLRRPGLYRVRVAVPGDRSTAPATAPDAFVRAVRVTGGQAAPRAR